MKNIEAEVRSFVNKEQYDALMEFFKKNGTCIKEDVQETFYFEGDADIRIQRNKFGSKIWLKKGQLHDEGREEIEVKCKREDFKKLEQLFVSLGFSIEIKWVRERVQFEWDSIKVCLDNTKGYGYIIELEKMCTEEEKEPTIEMLKKKMLKLSVPLTEREEFEKQFNDYKKNWRSLLGE